MFTRTTVALAITFAAGLMPAKAADALALKVLGYSPDGRYFGFVQYGPQWQASKLFAEATLIDASTDRLVPGTPFKAEQDMKDDATENNIEPELKAFLDRVARRSSPLFGKHRISKPGVALAKIAEARSGEHGAGSGKPGTGPKTIAVKHPKLGDLKITLELKEIDWPKNARLASHKEAEPCTTALDSQKGAGFRLTLERGNRPIVLNDDKTIPALRFCVMDYGIAEVHAFDRPDGKVTLAVVLGMESRGFEGQDRTFLAVTRAIGR